MRKSLRLAVGVVALVGAPMFGFAGELADAVPADAKLAMFVEDVGGLSQRFKASKYHEVWSAPECADLRALVERKYEELAREMQEEAESEVPLEKLVKLLSKEGVFYIDRFPQPIPDGSGVEASPHAVLAFDLDEEGKSTVDKLIEEQLAELPADAKRSTYTVGDATVYSLQWLEEEEAEDQIKPMAGEGAGATPATPLKRQRAVTMQYAHVGSRFAMGFGESEPLRRYLANLTTGDAGGTLAKSEAYLKSRALSGIARPDVSMYFNYPAMIADYNPPDSKEGEEMKRSMRALGLSDAGPALMSFALEGSGAKWSLANALPAEKKGVFSLFYNQPAVDPGAFSTVPGDAGMAVAWSLNGATLMRDVRALLLAVSAEGYGGLDMVFGMANAQLGVNLEADVIGQLGGDHVYYRNLLTGPELASLAAAPAGEPTMLPLAKSVLRLGFNPGSPAAKTVGAILDKFMNDPENPAPIERSEVQGFASYKPKAEAGLPPDISPSITLAPGALLVAFDNAVMQDAVRRLAGGAGDSFAQKAPVAGSLSLVDRADMKVFTFATEEANIENYEVQIGQLRKLAEAGMADPDSAEFFRALPPSSVLKGRVGDTWSAAWTRPDGMVIRSESSFR